MKIGLFGGTFNPIHYGHTALVRHIAEKIGLDEVWMLVTPQNPWKTNQQLLDDEQRLQMVSLALEGDAILRASDYEFHLEKPTYTYLTLRHLRKDFPEHEFVLIIGADNWVGFDRWSHPDEIMNNHRIVVFPRGGYDIDRDAVPERVTIVDAPLLPVSSTEIRRKIENRESITGLVAPLVEAYITENKLYTNERLRD